MRLSNVIVLMLFPALSAFGQAPSRATAATRPTTQPVKAHFRDATWEMSAENVRLIETAEFLDEKTDGNLYQRRYVGKLLGMDCLIWYDFAADKLFMGSYFIRTKHTEPNRYVDDFTEICEGLTRKYGQWTAGGPNWRSDTLKGDKKNWGVAIALGQLDVTYKWQLRETVIKAQITGDNGHTTIAISYVSSKAKALLDAARGTQDRDRGL